MDSVAIAALATRLAGEQPMPGLAWGVLAEGAVLDTGGVGWADEARRSEAGPAVAGRICSITKTMTAIAVMQLEEERRLELDDPVNRHLSSFRVGHPNPDAPPVTIRHLLTHTAGIGELHRLSDLRRPYAGLAVGSGRPVPSLRELYGPQFRTEVPAGSKWIYANHGFGILGQVVEDLRGATYGEVLRTRLLDPLGMDHTDVRASARVGRRRFTGYRTRRRRDRARPARDLELTLPAAGGVWSTVDDLLRYAKELLEPGIVVRPDTFATMTRSHFSYDDRLPGRGLGFQLGMYAGHRIVGHDGAIPGWTATLQIAPADGIAVVALANANNPAIGAAVHGFGLDVIRGILGLAEPAVDVESRRVDRLPAPLAQELCGTWKPGKGLLTSVRMWMQGGRAKVELHPDGHLVLRTPLGSYKGGAELVPVDADDPLRFDTIVRGLIAPVVFARGEGGTVDRLRLDDLDGMLELYRA